MLTDEQKAVVAEWMRVGSGICDEHAPKSLQFESTAVFDGNTLVTTQRITLSEEDWQTHYLGIVEMKESL
jgi:hypothetical protein